MCSAAAICSTVAPDDDRLQMRGRQRLEVEEQRRTVQFVEDRVDERAHQPAQLVLGRHPAVLDVVEQLHQPIERVLVAGEENLLLVLEVVIEVALLHVERRGDFLHGGAVIPEAAERFGGAFQDVDAGGRLGVGIARPLRPPSPRARARPALIIC